MIDENLKKYIDYYINQIEPKYAVLITGDWGIGKTYQVINALPMEHVCYISLFGLNSTSEIYANVFASMYPRRNLLKKSAGVVKESTSEINGITFGAGAIISSLADAFIKEEVDQSKVIVFDDLERCSIELKDILGAINKYIEHHKCRVIVIAHDIEIESTFKATKEKIIGHTIKIRPQIENAAESFFSETHRLKHYQHIKLFIISAFKKSACQSLRILRHVIKDCERLAACLTYSQLHNHDAMQELFDTFSTLNIEFRLGNLLSDEIENLDEEFTSISYAMPSNQNDNNEIKDPNSKENRLTKLFNKYSQEVFTGGIFDSKLIYSMLIDGLYHKNSLNDRIQESRYFKEKSKAEFPAWLHVQSFDYTEDHIVDNSVNQLLQQFKYREITDLGAMLHMFHLMFLMSSIKVINESFDEILEDCKSYINDLLLSKELPFSTSDNQFHHIHYDSSSHGHGFWLHAEYKKHIDIIRLHLKNKQEEALKNKYPEFGIEIINALDNNIEEFKNLLIGDGSTIGKYGNIDVLTSISSEDFVISWLCRPYSEWDKIRNILVNRYSRGLAINLLANEKGWLYAVVITLKLEAMKMKGFERLRIERIIPTRALAHL